ncbi:MAG: hypothetical protein OXQ84_02155 [bacterium]|nr:hypothetical protein [bacterium]
MRIALGVQNVLEATIDPFSGLSLRRCHWIARVAIQIFAFMRRLQEKEDCSAMSYMTGFVITKLVVTRSYLAMFVRAQSENPILERDAIPINIRHSVPGIEHPHDVDAI